MGSVEEKIDLDFDEEIPFSTSPSARKVHAFDCETTHVLSPVNLASKSIFKQMRIRPIRSIYIVLIKAKINMLLPFGPLAILLHYLTGKHVWIQLLNHPCWHLVFFLRQNYDRVRNIEIWEKLGSEIYQSRQSCFIF